jgi:hypothetical protein
MIMSTQRYAIAAGLTGVMLAATALMGAGAAKPTDQQGDPRVLSLIDRTTRDARTFDHAVDVALGRDPNRPMNPTPIEDDVDQFVNQLLDTAGHLRDHYTRRQVVNSDVEEVLSRGARIDAFMKRNRLAASAESSWLVVRADLDEVARAFNVSWNWTAPREPSPGPGLYTKWSGTYQVDRVRSDNAARIADQATRGLDPAQRQRVQQNLVNRLDPPEYVSLDRNGRTISIASSKAPQGTFDIDGVPRSETMPNGVAFTVRASFYGDRLMVTTTGSRGNDYTVTFEPLDGGQTLRVTRRLDVAALNEPVESQAYYHRTAEQPRWNVYQGPAVPQGEGYPVPDRTVLTARLDMPLGNRTSHQGDRFTLTVTEPTAFRGAVINGIVSKVNASNHPGRFDLLFDFDRIRLRDGQTGDFEGVLSQVRTPDGSVINIDTEGVVRSGEGRGDEAVERGTIGAAFGAIIGALAGGGKGAAIGAAVGAGAGAGSVYVEGRDLYLPPGTQVTVIATTPRRR